jgi:predicted NACHT family NTPase
MQESDAAAVAANTFRKVEWKVLRDELLRDGLVVQFGSMVSFAHHSFQEFLTARYLLEDLNGAHLSTYCDDYLRGSDWWQEVLCFYINLAGKSQETRVWLDERLKATSRYATAQERATFLRGHLSSSFPFAK